MNPARTGFLSILGLLAISLLSPLRVHAEDELQLITESTATIGRGGAFKSNDTLFAEIVGVADLGLRWVQPSGWGYGLSVLAGRDFPNEASLAGLRGRISRHLGRSTLEGSIAVISSSLGSGGIGHRASFGGIVSAAYYPRPWWGIVMQLDMVPTASIKNEFDYDFSRDPAFSAGLRLAEKPGRAPWIGAGAVALAWLISKD